MRTLTSEYSKLSNIPAIYIFRNNRKPFILVKDGLEYGPYKTQAEAFNTKILSEPSISRLISGKKDKINGFSIKKLY
jgi:hypothetical protein